MAAIKHTKYTQSTLDFSEAIDSGESAKLQPQTPSGLSPIIKWAGGKEKELKYILPNLPAFNRYIEPFVGGGAVYTAINAKQFLINDLSEELITLYRHIADTNDTFFQYSQHIDQAWINAKYFALQQEELYNIYILYRENAIDKDRLKELITTFCDTNSQKIESILPPSFNSLNINLLAELKTNIFRKFSRMRDLETQKFILPDKDVLDNIETSIKSALYMVLRKLYNDHELKAHQPELHNALFFFIRNYSYSGMFRYNDKGEFNVPYGGIAYNNKYAVKKLKYYQSETLLDKLRNTVICNHDFEDFLYKIEPQEDDFIFLDPPYDSEFNTYAGNAFTASDQKRLADYLINRCKAKWLMIIKNTELIFNLYNKPGIFIKTFNKEYLVSFMNRNERKVTHLLITNYTIP